MNGTVAEFSKLDGTPVTVNMDRIDYFEPCESNTFIVFEDGVTLRVRESYDAVAEVLNPERQAGC